MKSTIPVKKTFTSNDQILKKSWREGPIGDKSMEPGHDRPVIS